MENDMNESTLVPREEMSDLDWLARNVHEWSHNGDLVAYKWCGYAHFVFQNQPTPQGFETFTRDQWLARHAELQNKPSWEDAPEWAEWLAQDEDGEWKWLAGLPGKYVDGWTAVKIKGHCKGLALGDWRDTLEKRPANLSEQAITARLNEATDNVLAAVPELMTDKYKFDPFVSVEDAATAKQPAPKGSGNPILGMVLADLTNRALEGKEKYGEPLLAHNGRNPLWDAYQEALDLAMYLRQAIEEQE